LFGVNAARDAESHLDHRALRVPVEDGDDQDRWDDEGPSGRPPVLAVMNAFASTVTDVRENMRKRRR
jgi:hypothetical protein